MANLGYIQITRLCNQKCRICSNPEIDATLSLDEVKGLIDDFIERGYHGVILTGGEPTLHPKLPEIISYAKNRGIHARIITNGQKICDAEFLDKLITAGLSHTHISIYSHREEIQTFISGNKDSFKNALKAIENVEKAGITADINIAINHYNADHMHELVRFIRSRFPFIRHFVWNNLDPNMNRATQNPDVIHKLWEMEVPLATAMKELDQASCTFRAEKVPLCYMVQYAHCATETRKIVKDEERIVHFLDKKGMIRQMSWQYGKADCCRICSLDRICAGLYEMDKYYDSRELYPLFVNVDDVIKKII
jgi:MoaA/NifB/PqqE/SkfB family radical SAM enzyme